MICTRKIQFVWNVLQTGDDAMAASMQPLASVDSLCLCLFAAVWSWTSSCRRTSCSRSWRGSAPRTRPTSPLWLTRGRPSPPPPNASPNQTPRSTLAGNFGSYETGTGFSIRHQCTGLTVWSTLFGLIALFDRPDARIVWNVFPLDPVSRRWQDV